MDVTPRARHWLAQIMKIPGRRQRVEARLAAVLLTGHADALGTAVCCGLCERADTFERRGNIPLSVCHICACVMYEARATANTNRRSGAQRACVVARRIVEWLAEALGPPDADGAP